MKMMSWSSAALLSLTGLAMTHSNDASALTFEETACVAQTFLDGGDPTKCFNAGGDGGGAGSGGSGGGSGSTIGDGSGGGSTSTTGSDCIAPSFWFTGPVLPAAIQMSEQYASDDVDTWETESSSFTQSVGGKKYKYQLAVTGFTGYGAYKGGILQGLKVFRTDYTWTKTPVDSGGKPTGSAQTARCSN